MIERIEHLGPLIPECTLPGERRSDDVFPSHANGTQVARDRFLLIYATRGYRGVDDNLSVCYQLRSGDYDGPLIKEGFLVQSVDDWDPFADGHRYVRQHGHPVVFGVPAGAVIDGKVPAHAGLFAAKWRRVARRLREDEPSLMVDPDEHTELTGKTQGVEWMQFRVAPDGNDIEVVQPPQALRQQGYDAGAWLCEQDLQMMNQSYVQPVPYTTDGSEWVDINHFNQHEMRRRRADIAALRYRYHPSADRYQWVQTAPPIDAGLFEAALVAPRQLGADGPEGRWVIESRTIEGGVRAGQHVHGQAPIEGKSVGWARADDLFGRPPQVVRAKQPRNNAPLTSYRYADGALRLLTGDPTVSPYHNPRNPLYMWDIAEDDGGDGPFEPTERRLVFDIVAAGLPIPEADQPKCEMAKLLPHAGGSSQLIVHGVYPRSINQDYLTGSVADPEGKKHTGIYHARVHYTEEYPGRWQFS